MKIEWLIRNASLLEKYQDYKKELIKRIIEHYKAFAIIESKNDSTISGWYGFALSIFSAPRSKSEEKLQDKIYQAKTFLNSLYMSVVDEWEIDDAFPSETSQIENADGYNSLEALASYLSKEDKKELCHILGRNYLESELSASPVI